MENIMAWETVQMYCPNCGKKIMGYKNKKGVVKMQCDRCRYAIVTVRKTPRKYEITVEQPLEATI